MSRRLLRRLRRWWSVGSPERVAANAPDAADQARPFPSRSGLRQGLGVEVDLRQKFCANPWERFEVYPDGRAFVCCPKWLDTPVGNFARDELPQMWNGSVLQQIRAGILDGSFRYCVHAECPLIQSGGLPDRDAITDPRLRRIIDHGEVVSTELPMIYNLCYDESCNLQCPSCRRNKIHFAAGPEYEARAHIQRKILNWVFGAPHDQAVRLSVTGSGDPFGSTLFRELLTGLDGRQFPNLTVDLQTNGVLFTPANWERIAGLHGHIGNVMVSFDAARPETYAYTRRGGNWDKLLENVAFLSELRRTGQFHWLRLDFVVQQRNYAEMPEFVELAASFGAVDQVSFNLITDWGTYGNAFDQHAVWKPAHPEFQQFLTVLRDPRLGRPEVHLGNVAHYRTLALAPA